MEQKNTDRLIVMDGTPVTVTLSGKNEWAMGRKTSKNDPDIPLKCAFASRRHGRFFLSPEGKLFYEDVGSGNGSYVNGNKLGIDASGRPAPIALSEGDVIEIRGGSGEDKAKAVWIYYTRKPLPAKWKKASLSALSEKDALCLGRSKQADIRCASGYVSRRHAFLAFKDGALTIADGGSRAGTAVNGRNVTGETPLADHSVIRLADYTLFYSDKSLYVPAEEPEAQLQPAQSVPAAAPAPAPQVQQPAGLQSPQAVSAVTPPAPQPAVPKPMPSSGGRDILRANIMTKVVPNLNGSGKKELIRDVRLCVKEGALVALLGSSGAGKTTVMNCLNGMDTAGVRGQVLFYGEDLMKNFDRLKYQIGSVPQREVFHEMLTVEEELREAAIIRLPAGTDKKTIKMHVARAIRQLGLTNVRKNQISKCSGGEKRRVNIAIELVAERTLLCLDEPDAGLDPGMKLELFTILRDLAHNENKSILVIIHDVSEIHLFDQVVIMTKYNDVGRLAFSGSPDEAEQYFGCPFKKIYSVLGEHPERYVKEG